MCSCNVVVAQLAILTLITVITVFKNSFEQRLRKGEKKPVTYSS